MCAKKATGIFKTVTPSKALAAIVGSKPIARTDIMKKVWNYIKKHKLQDSKDKRKINADTKLKPIFGKSKISMLELAGRISKHVK